MGLLWIVLIILPLAITGFTTIYKKIPLKRFNEINAKEQCKRASVIALVSGIICGVTEGIRFYQVNNDNSDVVGFMFLLALIGAVIIAFVIFVYVSGLLLVFIWSIHAVLKINVGRKILKIGTKVLFWGINVAIVGGIAYLFVYNFFHGVNTGWLIPALANPNGMLYKWDTISETFGMLLLFPLLALDELHWLIAIPVFYFLYIIEIINRKKKGNSKNNGTS